MSMKYAIITMIKDEQEYLDEWLKHNINIGFTDIVIYEDYNSKSHKDICDKYPNIVQLHSITELEPDIDKLKNMFRQELIFLNARELYKNAFDYIALIDVDEYININYADGIPLLCEVMQNNNLNDLIIDWRFHTCSGHFYKPDYTGKSLYDVYPDIKQINKDDPGYTALVFGKHIIKGDDTEIYFKKDFHHPFPHFTHGNHANNTQTLNNLFIDHFITKSFEEYIERILNNQLLTGVTDSFYMYKNKKLGRTIKTFNRINNDYIDLYSYPIINDICKKHNITLEQLISDSKNSNH